MLKKSIIRPHRKCSCGSKKKYRNCCGKTNTVRFEDLPPETQKLYRETQAKYHLAKNYHTQHFGHVAGIESAIFNGRRLVGLQGSLVISDDPNYDWNSPIEFLSSHLKSTLGNDWFDEQMHKSPEEQHIIVEWATKSGMQILNKNKPLETTQFNGNALAYLHFAYDLFVVHNQNYLTPKLIGRLRNKDNFNGARYELFTLATLIRAGFELKIYDESLGKGKVAECEATHTKSKTILQVEAKARHVRGTHGSTHGKQRNFDLYKKCLKQAMIKNIVHPYIIFVDINIPELDVYNDQEKLDQIRKEYDKLQEQYHDKLPNIVCFTNIPFHYAKEYFASKNLAYGLILSNSPRIKLGNEQEILTALQDSLSRYAYLPREFNESRQFADYAYQQMTPQKP